MPATDSLLAEYVQNGSERAFSELVSSYVNFVYGTALRLVGGDSHLAEDVAQTVFIDLARKASSLSQDVKLGGWLHRHTCFVARKALRKERRRLVREKQAMHLQSIADYTQENLNQLAPVLDEVINKLGNADRLAIVTRFFEERDFGSVARVLGSSEDAARMRVARALEKMGVMLKRRGILISTSGVSFVLTANCGHSAPVALASTITRLALSQRLPGPTGIACLKQLRVVGWKSGLAGALGLLLAGLLVFPKHKHVGHPAAEGVSTTPAEFAELTTEEETETIVAPSQIPQQPRITVPGPVVSPVEPAKKILPSPNVARTNLAGPPKATVAKLVPTPASSQPSVPATVVSDRPDAPRNQSTTASASSPRNFIALTSQPGNTPQYDDDTDSTPQAKLRVAINPSNGGQWQVLPRAPIIKGNKNGQNSRQRQP
jgi:RNA polymerase sigma factor (sigma-70 family)